MTIFVTSNSIGAGITSRTLGTTPVFLMEGVIQSTFAANGRAFFSSTTGFDVTIAGIAEADYGIQTGGAASGRVAVTETGFLLGGIVGYDLNSTSSSFSYFSNAGLVQGGLFGVDVFIEGRFVGSNTGTIRGINDDGMRIQTQLGGSFVNYGLIETFASSSQAVDIYSDGDGTPVVFTNYGILRTPGEIALEMDFSDENLARNFGTIDGGAEFGGNDDVLINRGTINGNVDLQEGDDRYDGIGGVTNGAVLGGEGMDRLVGGDLDDRLLGEDGDDTLGGRGGMDTLSGGAGNDTIFGGAGADQLNGGLDSDRLIGNLGNDIINGGGSFDNIQGGEGEDVLNGQFGNDWVMGGSGDDLVSGQQGNDTLWGGAGNDTIEGGFGRDVMYGGRGEDTFVWNFAGDSPSFATRDRVLDFQAGEDILDFSQIVGPDITFRGSAAFNGVGPQLRVIENAFGSSVIQVDTNGNGFANMNVLVREQGLTVDDFLL